MTPERDMAAWILAALYELHGTAETQQVFAAIERRFGHWLDDDDLADVSDGRQEPRWRRKAHTARRRLVEKGLLHSSDVTGHSVWSLTATGATTVPVSHLHPVSDLCSSFRAIATDVQWRMRLGRSLGLLPGETTFTDNALLELTGGQRGRVSIQRFTSPQEAANGADWEWWIRDHRGYAGFRVQAKRACLGAGRIAFNQRAAPTAPAGEQIDVFAWNCRVDRIAGLYCIYSDALPTAYRPTVTAGGCPHGAADFRQWACAVLPVDTALLLRRLNTFDAEAALSYGAPWYQLVCHEPGGSATESVLRRFAELQSRNAAVRRTAYRLADIEDRNPELFDGWPLPSREPSEQIEAAFEGEPGTLQSWADLTGIVMIDMLGARPAAF
ncbi:hypothetical protein [Actinoplanes sp. NPDC051859]|uniref:hypothetical protein n=1 Tax=Actinoplanes sp. NPDC051859 TaxID=3363909 RepID=UPI0037A479DC